MTKEYNGWTNYETWLVHLWLSNDQGTDSMARELARPCDSDYGGGKAIREWLEGDDSPWPVPTSGLVSDLASAGLREVDWRSIGAAFRDNG